MANGSKTGGRQKGTLNKTTLLNREKLQKIFDDEVDSTRFKQALDMLPAKEYLNVMVKLVGYLLPKACKDTTAEPEPEEVEVRKRMFRISPIGEKEEVEQSRAADPEEAELAKLIYTKKEEPTATGTEGPKAKKRSSFLRFPIATKEEEQQLGREVDDIIFAKLIIWNEKNEEKWALEEKEQVAQYIREGKYSVGGSSSEKKDEQSPAVEGSN